MLISFLFFACHFDERNVKYIFHVFSEARDHILISNILFFNKLRQIIPEIRSERQDLLRVALMGHKMCIAFLIIGKDCDTCIQVFGQSPVDRM
jgi:hypothetical protein